DGRLSAEHESKQENELLHGDRLLHGLKPASAGRGGCLASAPDCKTPPTAIGLTSTGRTASSPGRASIGCSDEACSKASSARRPFTASETILPIALRCRASTMTGGMSPSGVFTALAGSARTLRGISIEIALGGETCGAC